MLQTATVASDTLELLRNLQAEPLLLRPLRNHLLSHDSADDTSKRAREFIVEISLNDAPVRRRIAVAFRATRRFCGLSRIRKIPIMIGIAPSLTKTLTRHTSTSFRSVAASTTTSAPSVKCCTGFMKDDRRVLPLQPRFDKRWNVAL